MSAITTFMPAPSSALAMPRPMPLAPPVTNAVLPGRFCILFPRSCDIVSNTLSPALAKQNEEGGTMVSDVHPAADAQDWPARRAAYYGLAVIIFATALNFMDAQIFS